MEGGRRPPSDSLRERAGDKMNATTAITVPGASARRLMLYDSMKHRTQLYLDDAQHRWLRQRAGKSGSIAAVVRELIDAERARRPDPGGDPLLSYLVEEPPGRGAAETSVSTLDRDLYGA